MKRFDRMIALLLFLRSKKSVTAQALARHCEVSARTIYRDLEVLSALGVPIYGERGHDGGFQLLEGYFLPPLMFTRDEAISLLLGLALLRGLHAYPFPGELAQAERKLLAALPTSLRSILESAEKLIGFEQVPHDIFHSELPQLAASKIEESEIVSIFLRAILDGRMLSMEYRSPYRQKERHLQVQPLGVFWDRNRWYLVGQQVERSDSLCHWRADRVLSLKAHNQQIQPRSFDVRTFLKRAWLGEAMNTWRKNAPVKLLITEDQAQHLRQDWYYAHANFEARDDGRVQMTFGECSAEVVLDLVRWLGPGAELLEPLEWRALLRDELRSMLASYEITPTLTEVSST